ncbi:MAG: alpha/beta hydrolase [Cyanobacteria bacterium SBC]|nr:alpha/beta hydrolase [Cyanobacteria bacterium SBC]
MTVMQSNPIYHLGFGVLTGLCLSCSGVKPTNAAERITLTYGSLNRSIPVASLETFAETGEAPADLETYLDYLNETQRQQLRQLLQQRIDESPAVVSRFTYSGMGEAFLQRIGQGIQTDSSLNGFHALRSAMILAASEPNGLTFLGILRQFPTPALKIDARVVLQLAEELVRLSVEREAAISILALATQQEAKNDDTDFSQLPDLQKRGNQSVEFRELEIFVNAPRATPWGVVESYHLPVDVYLPDDGRAAPLILLTHGMGSTRRQLAYLAEHLASYGFAVAVPEHFGSSSDYLAAFLRGELRDLILPEEYASRVRDIQATLDELERLTATEDGWLDRIDVENTGVMGYSFGGTTALSVAGAPLNETQLNRDCVEQPQPTFNFSVLLQCRASSIAPANFRDSRIRAVFSVYPSTSTIFGRESLAEIDVPTFVVSGSHDTLVPAVAEQIQPFEALTTPHRYLAVMVPGTHFSTEIGDLSRLPTFLVGRTRPDPEIGRGYLNALSVAFFQRHLAQNTDYDVYLNAAYAEFISQEPLNFYLKSIDDRIDLWYTQQIGSHLLSRSLIEFYKRPHKDLTHP